MNWEEQEQHRVGVNNNNTTVQGSVVCSEQFDYNCLDLYGVLLKTPLRTAHRLIRTIDLFSWWAVPNSIYM